MFNMSPEKFSEIAENLDPVKPLHVGWIKFNNILTGTLFFGLFEFKKKNLLLNMGHRTHHLYLPLVNIAFPPTLYLAGFF